MDQSHERSAREALAMHLPKVELHCHLPGAVPVEVFLELAAKNGTPVRSTDPASASIGRLQNPAGGARRNRLGSRFGSPGGVAQPA